MLQTMTKTTTYTYKEQWFVDVQEWTDKYEAYIYREGFPVKRLAFTTGKDQFSRTEFIDILEDDLLDDEIERYEVEIVEPMMFHIDDSADDLITKHICILSQTPFISDRIENAKEDDLAVYKSFDDLKASLIEDAAESGFTLPEYFEVFYGKNADNQIIYDDKDKRYIVTKFC